MVEYTNLLLIGGSSQNVGKTTLVIDLLKKYSLENEIVAIKTSCHFHGILDTDIVIANNNEFTIVKETTTNTGKDSARMLEAGANEVYFIQAKDEFIGEAYKYLLELIGSNKLIVCETASLRKYLIPKIFIALVGNINEELSENKQILKKADLFIEGYLHKKYNIESLISISSDNNWELI